MKIGIESFFFKNDNLFSSRVKEQECLTKIEYFLADNKAKIINMETIYNKENIVIGYKVFYQLVEYKKDLILLDL